MIERCKLACKVFGNFVDFHAKNSCFFIWRAFFCSSDNPVLDDVTLQKIEGQICAKLIVDLNYRSFVQQVTFTGLYVAVSRVRRGKDLRIMPIQPSSRNLKFLTTLQPSPKRSPVWDLIPYSRIIFNPDSAQSNKAGCNPPPPFPRANMYGNVIESENGFPNCESVSIADPTEPSQQLKRKRTSNHNVRMNPRLSDLFSTPASGAPIIVQLISEPCWFHALNLTAKKIFIARLIDIIGQVRPGTKWTQRGELYIYPTTSKQKNLLLQQRSVDQHEIACSLCKSEQEVRGVTTYYQTTQRRNSWTSCHTRA